MGVLRLILAISVVLNHSTSIFGISIVGGAMAVQIFFIISGFYMSLILNEKYISQPNSYSLFITNRLLRLYPLYWFVLGLILIKSLIIYVGSGYTQYSHFFIYHQHYDHLSLSTLIYLFFSNLFIVGQDIAVFLIINPLTGNLEFSSHYSLGNPPIFHFMFISQSWSIGLEIVFYIIAPFLVRRKVKLILAMIVILVIIRLIMINFGLSYDPWNYRFFPIELAFFLLGNISYRIYEVVKQQPTKQSYLQLLTFIVIFYTIFYNQLTFDYQSIVYFVIFTLALPFIFIHTKQNKLDIAIGELSYPIYICHLFLKGFLEKLPFTETLGAGLTLTLISMLFAFVLNKIIAEPIEKLRQKRVQIAKL